MGFFEKVADFFRFDWFLNIFRDHEEYIMTSGLRIAAYACVVIAVAYAVIAYYQFSNM